MTNAPNAETPAATLSTLTLDELIRGQLAGKLIALARYDEILWKIRAGYVAVLYGVMAFFIGKESKLVDLMTISSIVRLLFPLMACVSLCAFVIDLAFLLSKLRVVAARDALSDLAVQRAAGRELSELQRSELTYLLHLSGEAPTLPPIKVLAGGVWPIVGLYIAVPLTARLVVGWLA